MADFSIYDVKTVEEFYDTNDVNQRLKSGWVLLAVGFDFIDGESCKVYIMGNTKDVKPYTADPESRLAKLRNE